MSTFDPRLADYVSARWPALVRYATLLCGDPVTAEELTQSAVVRVTLRWKSVRNKDDPDAYVRQAILRVFLSRWRQIGAREVNVAHPPERITQDTAGGVVDHVDVRRALLALPPRQRAVLVLRYLDDLTEARTAEVLGCSVGTVKSQASKGLARLRTQLAVHEDAPVDRGGLR